jgi:hypothetical protein
MWGYNVMGGHNVAAEPSRSSPQRTFSAPQSERPLNRAEHIIGFSANHLARDEVV